MFRIGTSNELCTTNYVNALSGNYQNQNHVIDDIRPDFLFNTTKS